MTRHLRRNDILNTKDNELIKSPSRYFCMIGQCFAAARLTGPAYGAGRKRENSSVGKYRIIVASALDVPCSLAVI